MQNWRPHSAGLIELAKWFCSVQAAILSKGEDTKHFRKWWCNEFNNNWPGKPTWFDVMFGSKNEINYGQKMQQIMVIWDKGIFDQSSFGDFKNILTGCTLFADYATLGAIMLLF